EDHRGAPPSRTGLPCLPGDPSPGQALHAGAPGEGGRAGACLPQPLLQVGRLDPPEEARLAATSPTHAGKLAVPREHPEQLLLRRLIFFLSSTRSRKESSVILEQTAEKLSELKLRGMVSALEQWKKSGMKDLEPADLLGLLVDAECTARENRRLTQRLRDAHFPVTATVEAIDYQHSRGLSKQKLLELISSRWVHAHQNLIITGKTGLGKTYLPCALGNKACRDGHRVLYTRAPKLFGALYQARVDG